VKEKRGAAKRAMIERVRVYFGNECGFEGGEVRRIKSRRGLESLKRWRKGRKRCGQRSPAELGVK
jgi:hypothetical protein